MTGSTHWTTSIDSGAWTVRAATAPKAVVPDDTRAACARAVPGLPVFFEWRDAAYREPWILAEEEIERMPERNASTGGGLIRACRNDEFPRIHFIINDAAVAYRGVIPDDRWHEPYMSEEELEAEIAAGVRFLGWYAAPDTLLGVMGAQDVRDVTLIRHAYVLSASQRAGIGSALIAALIESTRRPLLVGTWKAATWAVGFYERHGFRLVEDTATVLRRYWSIPDRQIETSVVLADRRWFAAAGPGGAAST